MEIVTKLATSRSAVCATSILEAWHDDDRELLSRNLAQGSPEPGENSHECERLELLDGIAAQIRGSLESGRVQEASVFLPLLRHLAAPARAVSNRKYIS